MLISMIFVPLSSIIVIATSILMILAGQWMILVAALVAFVLLQFLTSLLAIVLGRDDFKLLIYAPLFIVGYKQFLDFVMIKALFDIIINRGKYTNRERVKRIGVLKQSTA